MWLTKTDNLRRRITTRYCPTLTLYWPVMLVLGLGLGLGLGLALRPTYHGLGLGL